MCPYNLTQLNTRLPCSGAVDCYRRTDEHRVDSLHDSRGQGTHRCLHGWRFYDLADVVVGQEYSFDVFVVVSHVLKQVKLDQDKTVKRLSV